MTRVLFIDDDVLSLELMSKVSTVLGFHAIVSTSALHGLQLAALEKPAVILVDMQMDEMDGMEFVRQVRSMPAIAHLPVLICSAGISFNDEFLAHQAGADGFLRKPIGLNYLLETVKQYTEKSQ
jgi:CheY-like chemotaxis protein